MPVDRRRQHSKAAARLVPGLFAWLSEQPDPSRALVARLSDPGFANATDWGTLVRAHAMDLWSDDAEEGLAWHQGLANGVDFLHQIWTAHLTWSGQPPQALSSTGFALQFLYKTTLGTVREEAALPPQGAPTQWRLLTMEDVAREVDAFPTHELSAWTRAMAAVLPGAPIPMLALAAGLWLGLAAAGRLTGVSALTLASEDLGWSARLSWEDVAQGQGPTGDQVPL